MSETIPTDLIGRPLRVGDRVAYATLNCKSATQRVGTLTKTHTHGEFLVRGDHGRSSWQRPRNLVLLPADAVPTAEAAS
jgi:hypothetical protein